MAIDWKTIISEFDGKPTLLQAIGKLRKAVEDETITIQQAQAEIAKLESQQKADEALIKTAQSTADEAKINAYNASQKGDQALGKATTAQTTANKAQSAAAAADTKAQAADTKAQNAQSAAQAADTKAQQALELATTNETDIAKLDGQVADIETAFIIPDDAVFPYKFDAEILFKIVNNIIKVVKYKNVLYYRCIVQNYEIMFVGFILSSDFTKIGQYHVLGADLIYATGEGVLVDKGKTDFLNSTAFKTIFGNQSLVGTGNIDLYRHDIAVTFSSADSNDIHVEFISSKNTVCDSLQDLKTVLGDSFRISANGTVFGIFDELSTVFVAEYMRETGIQTFYKETGSDFGAKFISFADNPFSLSDTVTTI